LESAVGVSHDWDRGWGWGGWGFGVGWPYWGFYWGPAWAVCLGSLVGWTYWYGRAGYRTIRITLREWSDNPPPVQDGFIAEFIPDRDRRPSWAITLGPYSNVAPTMMTTIYIKPRTAPANNARQEDPAPQPEATPNSRLQTLSRWYPRARGLRAGGAGERRRNFGKPFLRQWWDLRIVVPGGVDSICWEPFFLLGAASLRR